MPTFTTFTIGPPWCASVNRTFSQRTVLCQLCVESQLRCSCGCDFAAVVVLLCNWRQISSSVLVKVFVLERPVFQFYLAQIVFWLTHWSIHCNLKFACLLCPWFSSSTLQAQVLRADCRTEEQESCGTRAQWLIPRKLAANLEFEMCKLKKIFCLNFVLITRKITDTPFSDHFSVVWIWSLQRHFRQWKK